MITGAISLRRLICVPSFGIFKSYNFFVAVLVLWSLLLLLASRGFNNARAVRAAAAVDVFDFRIRKRQTLMKSDRKNWKNRKYVD